MQSDTRKGVRAIREAFDAASDAVWALFMSGAITHAEYRAAIDPLEDKLREELRTAREVES